VSAALLVDLASWACLVAGGLFALIGGVGLLRMPTFFTRMHAASVTDTVGAGLILLGLALQAGFTLVAAKLAVIGLLIFFTSPVATHALAKAALARGVDPLATEDAPSKR
jgi:multicomponent Na+:H+ antiporter subunit G